MKLLYQHFEDKDFEELKKVKLKSGLTWKEFILDKCLD